MDATLRFSFGAGLLTAALMLFSPSSAHAFPTWGTRGVDGGTGTQCAQCHGDFNAGATVDDLHDLHTANITDCLACHGTVGDDPSLGSSTSAPGFGCSGCHGRLDDSNQAEAFGLRVFHSGFTTCSDSTCHADDTAPEPEDVLPPNYGGLLTNVEDSCNSMGTEDWDDDGTGLDNDGDGVRDELDPDCMAAPDGGMPDAGMGDAGMGDAGMGDAGMGDAGTVDDAGTMEDAGPMGDAGPTGDAGVAGDGGAPPDGGDGDGCGCVTAGGTDPGNAAGGLLLIGGLAMALMRRRRRS